MSMNENLCRKSYREIKEKVTRFWQENKDKYPQVCQDELWCDILADYNCFEIPCEVSQIYDYLDLLKDENNIYKLFANFYFDYFEDPYNKNIIDIASGCIPASALRLQEGITLNGGQGKVTAYDPWMLDLNFHGLNVKRKEFTEKTGIKKADILTATLPCDATELIIYRAIEAEKEFLIQLCPCVPEEYSPIVSYHMWVNRLYDYVKLYKKPGFQFEIDNLDEDLWPLLSLKRK